MRFIIFWAAMAFLTASAHADDLDDLTKLISLIPPVLVQAIQVQTVPVTVFQTGKRS